MPAKLTMHNPHQFVGKRIDPNRWEIPPNYARCAMTGKLHPIDALVITFRHHIFQWDWLVAHGIAIEDAAWLSNEGYDQIMDVLKREGRYEEYIESAFGMVQPARAIPEPALDPEDTKPLPAIAPAPASPVEVDPVSEALETPQEAIQPLPACATCHKGYEWCFRRDCPHVPCQARDWYMRAYRYQRADTRYNIHVMDVYIDDVPIDVMIAARESAMARQQPKQEPFSLRAWYKKLLDARDALAHVPLHDNAAFNDAVLDFKCIKARYMKLEERWALRQAAGARR